jgi:hypothetical protein
LKGLEGLEGLNSFAAFMALGLPAGKASIFVFELAAQKPIMPP